METTKNKMMYFPNFKASLKLGAIVFGTSVIGSLLMVGIDYGMSWLMTLI